MVLEPKTGHVLAMVGGRDYRVSQFNRAVQAHRQAGSLLKPFVYLAAFEASREQARPTLMTPATLLADEPVTFESGSGTWTPQNYDQAVSTAGQLATSPWRFSSTCRPFAWHISSRHQPSDDVIRRFGLDESPLKDLSLALGSPAVSLLDMVTAYGGLANGGFWSVPLVSATDRIETGDALWSVSPDRRQAVSPQAAYLVTSLIEGVVHRGTGAKARVLGVDGPWPARPARRTAIVMPGLSVIHPSS